MKKITILLFLILSLVSCSKSLFYTYTTNTDYCTLELNNKNEIIYRATSVNYPKKYIYIKNTDGYFNSKNMKSISIDNGFDMYFLENNHIAYCPSFYYDKKYINESILFYQQKKDSLIRYGTNDSLKTKFPCLKDNNIDWFPEHLIKVDKIEYEKFNLGSIKKKYLKKPHKAQKSYK